VAGLVYIKIWRVIYTKYQRWQNGFKREETLVPIFPPLMTHRFLQQTVSFDCLGGGFLHATVFHINASQHHNARSSGGND